MAQATSRFSDDGKYLMLSSARDFKPTFGEEEFENVYRDMERVYLVTLVEGYRDTRSARGATKSARRRKREGQGERQGRDKKRRRKEARREEGRQEPTKKPVAVKVDLDGIHDRIVGLDITPGNYQQHPPGRRSHFLSSPHRRRRRRRTMMKTAARASRSGISAPTAWKIARRPCSATSTATRSRATARRCWSRSTRITPSSICRRTRLETKDHKLKLAGLDMQLDRHAEWNQIYFEAWRQMRDFFYAPNMNGVDWKAMRDKYAALAPVRESSQRSDLSHRRADRRAEQRPRLCRRRRTAGNAAHQARACSAPSFRAIRRPKPIASIASCRAKTGTSTRVRR